jgi:hypothetical protein
MMVNLAVARLRYCSNSFTPQRTRAVDLEQWGTAPASGAVQGDDEFDGVNRFLASRPHWNVTMLRSLTASPGGPLAGDVFGAWMNDVETGLLEGRFDGVYLCLHGACQAEGDPAVDLTVLRRVRAIMGHTPVVASFDMRANLSEETAILLDGASTSRGWPAGGEDDAAIRALSMLEQIIAGAIRPVGALARVPMLLPEIFLREAMTEVWAKELPAVPQGVLDASVHFGFAWGDSPYAGPSALVWADRDAGLARETAARLAISLVRWRSRALPQFHGPMDAIAGVLAARNPLQPGILLDPSDDPGVGGLADTPALLAALLEQDADLPGRVLLAALHDPGAVEAACAAGPGGGLRRALCARSTALYGLPVERTWQVLSLAVTPQADEVALLRSGQVDVLVVSRRMAGVTPALLGAAKISPNSYVLLTLKAGEPARQSFSEIGGPVQICDCPGPANPDLTRLPFHYVPSKRRMAAGSTRGETNAAHRGDAGTYSPMPRNAGAVGAATGAVASDFLAHSLAEKNSADQSQDRHEDRRANAQQKRTDTLGSQRRQIGV